MVDLKCMAPALKASSPPDDRVTGYAEVKCGPHRCVPPVCQICWLQSPVLDLLFEC